MEKLYLNYLLILKLKVRFTNFEKEMKMNTNKSNVLTSNDIYKILTTDARQACEQVIYQYSLYKGTVKEYLTDLYNDVTVKDVNDTLDKFITRVKVKVNYYNLTFQVYNVQKKVAAAKKTLSHKDKTIKALKPLYLFDTIEITTEGKEITIKLK